jgi:hypothetical protein
MVQREVYRKKGVWNFVTLEYDLEACGNLFCLFFFLFFLAHLLVGGMFERIWERG